MEMNCVTREYLKRMWFSTQTEKERKRHDCSECLKCSLNDDIIYYTYYFNEFGRWYFYICTT